LVIHDEDLAARRGQQRVAAVGQRGFPRQLRGPALPGLVQALFARNAGSVRSAESRPVRRRSGQARREDRLRSDLYYALTGLLIRVPPLRQRLEELPLLAQHCLERANDRGTRRHHGFTPEALEVLAGYDWPGNLRELGRVIDAAHERAAHDLIGAADLPSSIRGSLGAAYTPPVASTAASRAPSALAAVPALAA
jgi:DNA-binding NtrC family response regulator